MTKAQGHVYRWDLDKTYLETDFDSLAGLVRTALQSAGEKANVPGTAALMRELRVAPDGTRNRIHVVSGSPRQMRRVLEQKLRMDGADVDSLTLKPNVLNALKLRFRALKDQLGYKLPALLESRAQLGEGASETCFGDDAEMDGVVYRLYADICAHRVRGPALDTVISAARLYPDQADRIRRAAAALPPADPVQRILIHLDAGSPTGRFVPLGPRVVPTFDTFQAALVVYGDGNLTLDGVARVTDEMTTAYGYTLARLEGSLADAARRGIVSSATAESAAARMGLAAPPPAEPRAAEEPDVDYVSVLADVREYHAARKRDRHRRPSVRNLLWRDDG